MSRCAVLVLVPFLLTCGSTAALAQDTDAFFVSGSTSSSFTLDVDTSPETTRGFAVYSEPSNTLLLAVVDSTYAQTSAGAALKSALQAHAPRSYVETALPSSSIQVTQSAPPSSSDTNIKVYIWGVDGSTTLVGDLIGDANLGDVGNFDLGMRHHGGGSQPYHICVTCGSCGTMCADCTGPGSSTDCVHCSITCT